MSRNAALTAKQAELLRFIAAFQRREAYSPSYAQMAAAIGLSSKSGISRLVAALEQRGFIRRHTGATRAIEILIEPSQPETACQHCGCTCGGAA